MSLCLYHQGLLGEETWGRDWKENNYWKENNHKQRIDQRGTGKGTGKSSADRQEIWMKRIGTGAGGLWAE